MIRSKWVNHSEKIKWHDFLYWIFTVKNYLCIVHWLDFKCFFFFFLEIWAVLGTNTQKNLNIRSSEMVSERMIECFHPAGYESKNDQYK